jgi:hypothetical protein
VRALAWVVVAGCAPPATPPVIAHRVAIEPVVPLDQRTPLWDRRLAVGVDASAAYRGILELTIVGATATLVETDLEAPGGFTLERADREAKWTTTRTHVETGPMRHDGDHIELDLESGDNSLDLRCWQRSIVVATAGAHRVQTHPDCDDAGAWSPATTTHVDALICGQGDALDDGQLAGIDGQGGAHVDETLWRFAAAPGIELVSVSDGCWDSTSLRLAK